MPTKLVVQNVEKAKLKISDDGYVEIGKGLIVYICFLKNTSKEEIPLVAKAILNTKIFNVSEVEKSSIKESQGDVLLIPQASMGGKIKNNRPQYHGIINFDEGKDLYNELVAAVRSELNNGGNVQCGTYGYTQTLSFESLGPFTHAIDL